MACSSLKACGLLTLLALAACAGGGAGMSGQVPQANGPAVSMQNDRSSLTTSRLSVAQSAGSIIAINAGGGDVKSWTADTDYSGGWTSSVNSQINTSNADNPAPRSVYQTQRVGAQLTYTVGNLAAGAPYTVRLHFAETWFSSGGQRVFGATINGIQDLSNFDIYQAAGGKNIAITKQYSSTADAGGKITIVLLASVNNAAIAGIEIFSGSSGAPGPAPTSAPSSGSYPIYSSYFTGNTPFHHTVKQLLDAGATVLSPTISNNYWSEGIAGDSSLSHLSGRTPLNMTAWGQAAYVFTCPAYGTCNANGLTIHLPSSVSAQTGSDHHLTSFDPVYLHGEVDGWGGDGNSNQACNLNSGNPGSATCSWGGFYPFNGNGLESSYSSGNAGGYAFGLMLISAGELLAGHIDHALGIEQSCLDDGGVYPSAIGRASDAYCPSNLEPNAKYGQLIHLKSSVDVSSLGYSRYCQTVVHALQTYGAYTADNNGSWGISVLMEDPTAYSSGNNPWINTIFPSMVAGGDGSGSGSSMRIGTCLQRIPASDIEVIQISSNLPS